MTTRTRDIKTVYKVITKQTALNIGGMTPAGMKRWVTFLSVDALTNARVSSFKLYLASVGVSNPTLASIVATGNRKYNIGTVGTQMSRVDVWRPITVPPAGPEVGNPLFSIAASKWLGVYASLSTVGAFMQYFDE
jgi:hypothetical protein